MTNRTGDSGIGKVRGRMSGHRKGWALVKKHGIICMMKGITRVNLRLKTSQTVFSPFSSCRHATNGKPLSPSGTDNHRGGTM